MRGRGVVKRYLVLGAGAQESLSIDGDAVRAIRVAIAAVVFFLGVLAGGAGAAWIMPPV
jgi:hypothetical protein